MGITASMDASKDLVNASHKDARDASPGVATWTDPGKAKNVCGSGMVILYMLIVLVCCHTQLHFSRYHLPQWFFVMPDLRVVSEEGKSYDGVLVCLHHGLSITWDGQII